MSVQERPELQVEQRAWKSTIEGILRDPKSFFDYVLRITDLVVAIVDGSSRADFRRGREDDQLVEFSTRHSLALMSDAQIERLYTLLNDLPELDSSQKKIIDFVKLVLLSRGSEEFKNGPDDGDTPG